MLYLRYSGKPNSRNMLGDSSQLVLLSKQQKITQSIWGVQNKRLCYAYLLHPVIQGMLQVIISSDMVRCSLSSPFESDLLERSNVSTASWPRTSLLAPSPRLGSQFPIEISQEERQQTLDMRYPWGLGLGLLHNFPGGETVRKASFHLLSRLCLLPNLLSVLINASELSHPNWREWVISPMSTRSRRKIAQVPLDIHCYSQTTSGWIVMEECVWMVSLDKCHSAMFCCFWGEAPLLAVRAFLLTVELLCLQSVKALIRRAFPL